MNLPGKIISGGQTGADRAGLDFAIQMGVDHGGWCPQGRRSEDGPIPQCYNLTETTGWGYKERTLWNVRDADATLIVNLKPGRSLSPGAALTLQACVAQQKPYLLLRPWPSPEAIGHASRELADFLAQYQPAVLNVAGNREESVPGIHSFVSQVLAQAWAIVPQRTPLGASSSMLPQPAVARGGQMGLAF